MKKIKLLVVIFCISICFNAGAVDTNCDKGKTEYNAVHCCWEKISQSAGFKNTIKDIFSEYSNTDNIPTLEIQEKKDKIYNVLGRLLKDTKECIYALEKLANTTNGKVRYKQSDTQTIDIRFKVEEMLKYAKLNIGYLVINEPDKKPGDVLHANDYKKYFFSKECSDHEVSWSIDDTSGVNIAGSATFKGLGSNLDVFLDFPTGHGTRAFPGLVILESTSFGDSTYWLAATPDIKAAMNGLTTFHTELLKQKSCGNQGLNVYLVLLDSNYSYTGLDSSFPIIPSPDKNPTSSVTIITYPKPIP